MNNNNFDNICGGNKIETLLGRVFIISVFLLASMYTLSFSELSKLKYATNLLMAMRITSYALILFKFIVDLVNKKYKGNEIYIIVLGLYLSFISYRSHTINYLVYYIYIVVGKDVKYDNILKVALAGIFAFTVLTMSLSLIGIIRDSISEVGARDRHTLGFAFPACGANYVLYIILYYIYIRKDKMKLYEILGLSLFNLFTYLLTNTKSAFACGMLALLFTIVVNYKKEFRIYNKMYTYILHFASIFFPLFAVAITYVYNASDNLMMKINRILSGRLELGKAALDKYGLSLFGQYIKFTVGENADSPYNVIDSSYLQYLLILGVIFFVFMIIMFLYFSNLIDKNKDIYLFYILFILLMHSTFDKILLQMSNNYFMFIWSYKNSIESKMEYSPTSHG